MPNNFKIVADPIKNSAGLLVELNDIIGRLREMSFYLQPFGNAQKAKYKTLPRFVVESKAELMKFEVKGFFMNYPVVSEMLTAGTGEDTAIRRLHTALHNLGALNNNLTKLGYMVKRDEDRVKLNRYCNTAIASFCAITIIQFKLHQVHEQVCLSVSEFCDKNGMTPSVFYGSVLTTFEEHGGEFYGYEEPCPWYTDVYATDPSLVGECSDIGFPLTSEMCERICSSDGMRQSNLIHKEIEKFSIDAGLHDMVSDSEDELAGMITPLNMLQKLNLV